MCWWCGGRFEVVAATRRGLGWFEGGCGVDVPGVPMGVVAVEGREEEKIVPEEGGMRYLDVSVWRSASLKPVILLVKRSGGGGVWYGRDTPLTLLPLPTIMMLSHSSERFPISSTDWMTA